MRILYSDLDLSFLVSGRIFKTINVILEELTKRIPSHSHGKGCYELHYISSGYGIALINNQSYNVSPHTLYVTGPQVEHSQISDPDNPMVEYCIYLILPKSLKEMEKQDRTAELFEKTTFWLGRDRYGIELLLHRLFYELRYQQTGYITQVQALLSQIVVTLVRNYEQPYQPTTIFLPSNLENSKSLILEESFLYEYADISLEKLSSRLALSTRQTERFIRELYGKTFRQKKTEARMSAAALLLADSEKSISEIAEELGYSSVEHFSTAFRRFYEKNPSAYRHQKQIVIEP